MNSLLQTICRIGIFMICAQAVVHFRPQASYEKYLKLLVSAMVLIQLFLPVSSFLFHGDGKALEEQTQEFLEGLQEELSAAENRAYETDALLEQMTLEEIRKRVEEGGSRDGGMESVGTGDGRGENVETEDSGTGGAEPGDGEPWGVSGTADGETDNNTVQIDRIQVEEIRVQPEDGSPE